MTNTIHALLAIAMVLTVVSLLVPVAERFRLPHTVLLTIGGTAFSNCTGLTSVNIPNLVKYIPDVAFANCSALKSLTIPGSVTNIGPYAFTFSGRASSVALRALMTSSSL